MYKAQGWQKVSEHVGDDITVAQCANRWHNYLSKIQHEGSQRRAWSAEEVRSIFAIKIASCCFFRKRSVSKLGNILTFSRFHSH